MEQKFLKQIITQLTEYKDSLNKVDDEDPNYLKLITSIVNLKYAYKEGIKKDLKKCLGRYFNIDDYSFEDDIDNFRLKDCTNVILDADGNEYTIGQFIGLLSAKLWGDEFIKFMNSYSNDIEYVFKVAIEYREDLVQIYLNNNKETEKEKEEDGE